MSEGAVVGSFHDRAALFGLPRMTDLPSRPAPAVSRVLGGFGRGGGWPAIRKPITRPRGDQSPLGRVIVNGRAAKVDVTDMGILNSH